MAAAPPAVVFSARHDQLEIDPGAECLRQRLRETGPAGAAVVFRCGAEQRPITACAVVSAGTFLSIQRTAEGAFGAFPSQHLVRGRAESLLPGRVAEVPGRIGRTARGSGKRWSAEQSGAGGEQAGKQGTARHRHGRRINPASRR